MRYNQYLTSLFMIALLFLVSCHGMLNGQPRGNIMPCTVGLTLKPGESCRYTNSNDDFIFDFIFSAIKGGASFPYLDLKSPSLPRAPFGPTNGPTALNGGTATQSYSGDSNITIAPARAAICLGRSVFEIRGPGFASLPPGLGQKCFSASKNSDGSWTIQQIPLP